jgi:hypothetical protein
MRTHAGTAPPREGFNLLTLFSWHGEAAPAFAHAEFAPVADWGFDFLRVVSTAARFA